MPPAVNEDRQPTVLVVEDDETTRDAMAAVLAREGYLALTAASGHDTFGILQAPLSPIDVVLLDINLPDVGGADLCARIRELQPKVPVIVITGVDDPEEMAHLMTLGIHRYFRKPVGFDELLSTVEAALPS